MKDKHIIWHANQMAEHEKRFITMMINDLSEIEKMPLFATKSKIKKTKKKYLDWKKLHKQQ